MTYSTFCLECGKECDTFDRLEIDHEPYGDQIVERVSTYVLSRCCAADIAEINEGEVIH